MKKITTDGENILMFVDENTKIKDVFNKFKQVESDINQHLFTLYLLAKDCNHVTEMGSRWGHSTFSILSSGVNQFIAYDLDINDNIELAFDMSIKENINFQFNKKNVLEVDISEFFKEIN